MEKDVIEMNIDEKDVSVVIPLYNGEETILKTLKSIANQSGNKYIKEIIVVNDGSTDNSRKLVEKFSCCSPVKIVLINCSNGGVSRARNIGMKKASGRWIALCDADDEWLNNKLIMQVEIINNYNFIDFLGGNHVNKPQKYLFCRIKTLRKITVKELCLKTLPQTSTVIFKRDILEKIDGYDEKQRYAEDGNFFMKIAANYNYFYDPRQVVVYGDGKEGFGESGLSANLKEMHRGLVKNFREIYQLGYISKIYLAFVILVEEVKYARRRILIWIKK